MSPRFAGIGLVYLALTLVLLLSEAALRVGAGGPDAVSSGRHTLVSIAGGEFHINGRPTYEGRIWRGRRIQGLLINARLVQGVFDDRNPDTVKRWAYPDSGRWDPDRNTSEFIESVESVEFEAIES